MYRKIFIALFFLFCLQAASPQSMSGEIEKELQENLNTLCNGQLPEDFSSALIATMKMEKIPLTTVKFIMRNLKGKIILPDPQSLEKFLIFSAAETDRMLRKGETAARVKIKLTQLAREYKKDLKNYRKILEYNNRGQKIREQFRTENLNREQQEKREENRRGQQNSGGPQHGQNTESGNPNGNGGNGGGNGHGGNGAGYEA